MPPASGARAPQVFLSYARANLKAAEELALELRYRDIEPFLDVWNIEPGANVMLEINEALAASDYYVLLWSAIAEGRYWVETEYTAALVREERLPKTFLFVVRLDDSDPPTVLAPRQFLDAFGDRSLSTVADALAAVWLRDYHVGARVMPAPKDTSAGTRPTVRVYARNRELSVALELTVPEETAGRELGNLIIAGLKLPAEYSEFDGRVGVRFTYEFLLDFAPIPDTAVRLADGVVIDIVVWVESFGPGGSTGERVPYLPAGSDALALATRRSYVRKAFKHLMP